MATQEIIEHRKFSLTNLGENNNKFWNITLYSDNDVSSEWGRQGDGQKSGQTKRWSGAGLSFMEKKIREKEKKGYRENKVAGEIVSENFNNLDIKNIAIKQIRHTNILVQELIDYLVKINAHNILQATKGKIIYDTSTAQFKTTQGVIIPDQIIRARNLLSDLSDKVVKNDYDFEDDLNEYLSLIPRDFGRRRMTPKDILPDIATIRRENDILDGLDASFAGIISQPVKTTKKKNEIKVFDVELSIIEDNTIIKNISNLFEKSKKSMHYDVARKKVKDVYAISIKNMKDVFEKKGRKYGNIMRLWHGTSASNLLSIMRQGLIIPPAQSSHCTGRMYQDGLYFSSVSTKALNYATNFWGEGKLTSRIFMFLCDVAMGKSYIADSGWGKYPKKGYDSTWAKGGQSGVINDEMIVYKTFQANLIYLIEFE